MLIRRLLETIAMMMIGDSLLAILSPSRHLSVWLAWRQGPEAPEIEAPHSNGRHWPRRLAQAMR